MNPETTLTKEQIIEIFAEHKLAPISKIRRITTGFTNEVYEVDEYILKVCGKSQAEHRFDQEVYLYKVLQGIVRLPKVVATDISRSIIDRRYMIYEKLKGNPLGSRWHLLTDSQREQIIKDLCNDLKLIDNFPYQDYAKTFNLDSHPVWSDVISEKFSDGLDKLKRIRVLGEDVLDTIQQYINKNQSVLEPQKLGLVYWDVQLDNIIVSDKDEYVGLIDFENLMIASIDYRLFEVKVMSEHAQIFMAESLELDAKIEDYKNLTKWYKKYYSELFDFPELDTRIKLYELIDVLEKLPDWPTAHQLHERLENIIH